MRFLKGDLLFDGTKLHKNAILVMHHEEVRDVIFSDDLIPSDSVLENYPGILCPGFINTHCHIELSHLKNKLPKHTGLPDFINSIQALREASDKEVERAVELAVTEMHKNGIVAVGDISNGLSTLNEKAKGKLKYHTFVESFGWFPEKANEAYKRATELKHRFENVCKTSIVPHAPYSVSDPLLLLISQSVDSVITMHNQECKSEDELFKVGKGDLYLQLEKFGLPMEKWQSKNTSSLRYTLPFFSKEKPIILVHNTFASHDDLIWANKRENIYWCACPKANLFIENQLPNYDLWTELDLKVTLGTDSLASNDSLDIWGEIKTIHKHHQHISLEKLLTWATSNGAEALGFEKLGNFNKKSSPGVVHLPLGEKLEGNSKILINFAG